VRDAGNLLTRAGLNIPAVDVDDLVVRYSTPMELIAHLRAMAETNAVKLRRGTLRCWLRSASLT
jgi:NADH dehydrogenase [ubiquinone] 1 alpha subcomplex assembly factor 5